MKNVLHVFSHLNNAGTEKVIYNICNNMNNNKINFNILVFDDGTNEEIFEKLNIKIFKIYEKEKKSREEKIFELLKNNKYDFVHVHVCRRMYEVIKLAKKAKVKRIILHAHNARQNLPKIVSIYKIFKEIHYIDKYVTDYLACSTAAAKWMFPLKYKKTHIIYNGINMKKFEYQIKTRKRIRQDFGINDNDYMIISVGRLSQEKNMDRIIEIAKEQNDSRIKYFIIGDGELKSELRQKIDLYKLQNRIYLLGNINNVNELMCAADLFLLTSKYEGLGIVLIEAQTSGLYVVASDIIPDEADMNLGLLSLVGLKENNKQWIEAINIGLKKGKNINREKIYNLVKNTKYNEIISFDDLEKIYCEELV